MVGCSNIDASSNVSLGLNSSIAAWVDLSGSGNNFFQTNSNKPVLINTAINSLPEINFSSDYMSSETGILNSNYSFFIIRPTSLGSENVFFEQYEPNNSNRLHFALRSNQFNYFYAGQNPYRCECPNRINYIYSIINDPNDSQMYINGLNTNLSLNYSTPDTSIISSIGGIIIKYKLF